MTITCDETNETLLSGQVVDQAALYGILNKIQALTSHVAFGPVRNITLAGALDASLVMSSRGERSHVALE